MQILRVASAGADLEYRYPDNKVETYPAWISYVGLAGGGPHELKIAFGRRHVYGAERVRVLVLIDGYPHAEFFGADDIGSSGEVLSEIKLHGEVGEPICRYPDDPVPDRYAALNVVGMPTRVLAKGVHSAWAVVANISDHRTMLALAALRRGERAE
jgi:hypothetical protein